METDVKKVKQAKENKKSGILKSFKNLWSIMGTKEKISFILILFSELLVPIIKLWQAFLPSLILSRIIGEDVLIWGFINFSAVSDVAYYAIVLMSIPVLWVFGMLVYRAIDIFARRMMCKANEKVQDLLLEERKNLDFKMTNGEVYYIVKNAVDNIYNIIEPALWEFYANILSLIILCVQFFVYDINVGFIVIAYLCLLLVCVFVRTLVQEKVVGKIENINAKIGNHFLMSLTNLPMITMFSSKLKELSVLKNLNDDFYKENKTRANIGFWYWVIIIVVEYGGMLGIVLYLVLTNQPNLATTIISTLTMIESMISMVENWGFSLNYLQVASIKLCNIEKIYPEKKDLIKVEENNIDLGEIKSIEVQNYEVKTESFEKTYNYVFSSGKVYLLSGESGAGKTTFINAMCGLREIVDGKMIVNGKYEIKNLYNYRNHIVYLFQESILFDRSLAENLAYPDDEMNEKAKELTEKFKMKKLLTRKVDSSIKNLLSGGEKKRVDIIRTLSKDKEIYLFDEPTNELDSENVGEVLEEIKKIAKEDKIVIIISHDDRCFEIADDVVYL